LTRTLVKTGKLSIFAVIHCRFYRPAGLLAAFELRGASVFFLTIDAMHCGLCGVFFVLLLYLGHETLPDLHPDCRGIALYWKS